MKIFLRVLLALFFSLHVIGYAQTEADAKKKAPQVQEAKPGNNQVDENFFETFDDSPVSYKGAFVKMMLTLLALVALIVISVWMLRRISHGRMKQMNYGRSIKVLERRPLSAKSILYLVEISGKKVVVAESQVEVRAITNADHLRMEDE